VLDVAQIDANTWAISARVFNDQRSAQARQSASLDVCAHTTP